MNLDFTNTYLKKEQDIINLPPPSSANQSSSSYPSSPLNNNPPFSSPNRKGRKIVSAGQSRSINSPLNYNQYYDSFQQLENDEINQLNALALNNFNTIQQLKIEKEQLLVKVHHYEDLLKAAHNNKKELQLEVSYFESSYKDSLLSERLKFDSMYSKIALKSQEKDEVLKHWVNLILANQNQVIKQEDFITILRETAKVSKSCKSIIPSEYLEEKKKIKKRKIKKSKKTKKSTSVPTSTASSSTATPTSNISSSNHKIDDDDENEHENEEEEEEEDEEEDEEENEDKLNNKSNNNSKNLNEDNLEDDEENIKSNLIMSETEMNNLVSEIDSHLIALGSTTSLHFELEKSTSNVSLNRKLNKENNTKDNNKDKIKKKKDKSSTSSSSSLPPKIKTLKHLEQDSNKLSSSSNSNFDTILYNNNNLLSRNATLLENLTDNDDININNITNNTIKKSNNILPYKTTNEIEDTNNLLVKTILNNTETLLNNFKKFEDEYDEENKEYNINNNINDTKLNLSNPIDIIKNTNIMNYKLDTMSVASVDGGFSTYINSPDSYNNEYEGLEVIDENTPIDKFF